MKPQIQKLVLWQKVLLGAAAFGLAVIFWLWVFVVFVAVPAMRNYGNRQPHRADPPLQSEPRGYP